MALIGLNLESLSDMDGGRPAAAFMHELKRAVQDCIDRPGDETAREVTMTLKLTPVNSTETGVVICEGCHGEFQFKSKVPTRRTKIYSFKADKNGNLIYSTESPENADQTTIDEMDREGRVRRQREE